MLFSNKGGGAGRDPYVLVGGPLLAGEELVLVAALDGAADAVDALVRLLGGEALEGELDGLALLLHEVVVSIAPKKSGSAKVPFLFPFSLSFPVFPQVFSSISIPMAKKKSLRIESCNHNVPLGCLFFPPLFIHSSCNKCNSDQLKAGNRGYRRVCMCIFFFLPETQLAVPRSTDVPVGDGLEHVVQPRPLEDIRGEGDHRFREKFADVFLVVVEESEKGGSRE